MTTTEIILLIFACCAFSAGLVWGWHLNVVPKAKVVIHKSLEQLVDEVGALDDVKKILKGRIESLSVALEKSKDDALNHKYIKGLYDAYFHIYSILTEK